MKRLLASLVLCGTAALTCWLGWALLLLPAPVEQLSNRVAENIDLSGVSHPVTAVLLNFRGYDTLLEVAVLLLTLVGVLSLQTIGGRPAPAPAPVPVPILQLLARLLPPITLLTAGYLLWAGASQPGGAFQAGSVLAATAVPLQLANLLPLQLPPGKGLRTGLVAGLLLFLLVAAGSTAQGILLALPPSWAGWLILLIETGLTVSLACILAGLYLVLYHFTQGSEP